MEEEISAISTNTRIDKIKNFIIQNRTKIILLFCILLVLLFAYFFIGEQNKKKKNVTQKSPIMTRSRARNAAPIAQRTRARTRRNKK